MIKLINESLADYEYEKEALAEFLNVDVSEIEKGNTFVGWHSPTFRIDGKEYVVTDEVDIRSDIYDFAKRKIADDWDSYGFDMFGGDSEPIQYVCLHILGDDFFSDLLDSVHYDDDDYESDYLYAWEEFQDTYGLDEEVVTSAVDIDALAEYLIDNYGIANYVSVNGEENYEGEYFIYQIY